MEEDYVSFKTAKLIKKRGFNEPCRYFYDNDGRLIIYAVKFKNGDGIIPKNYCACPTQSILVKWFREKFNIIISIYKTWAMDNSYNYEILNNDDWFNVIKQDCNKSRSYSQAMEDGFNVALKLLLKLQKDNKKG